MHHSASDLHRDGDDAALAARAARGDHAAFNAIMRANNPALYRIARGILRDDSDAEDALQSSYLKAYVALPRFAGRAALSTWLARIVINESLERRRQRARESTAGEPAAPADGPGPHAIGAIPRSEDPEARAARAELARVIENAIDALPDPFRVVFAMRAIEECSVEEIAAALEIADATVRTRYHRARLMLQQRLRRDFRAALDDVFPFAGARCENLRARVLARLPDRSPDPVH